MASAKPNQKISLDKLEATRGKLEQLEEKQPQELTLRESIHFLRDKLLKALKKGYSYQDLSEILEQQGILVSAATLKQYLTESSKEAAKGKRRSKSGEAGQTSSKASEKDIKEESRIITESQSETESSLTAGDKEENQEINIANDTKSVRATDVNLLQENTSATLGENQQSTKKPVRGKSKKLSSSNIDLSSEFNQY